MNISPARREEIRAGLQRDFDRIFDEVDPAVYERDPAAALQGFPASYRWHGTESQIAQMVANAMPRELAGAIAGSLAAGCC
ncbi:MAG: DNA cytosine methyltransferase [Methanoregula sp.]|nr:DNA cytosine methyltransferase [Methanoregula sp.]